MAIPTTSWDETSPSGNQSRALGDDRIREMKTQIREVIAVDHEMASSGNTDTTGQHNKATLLVNADDPTEQANAGIVYTKDVSAKAELFFKDEDAHEIQLTSGGAINPLLLFTSGRFKIGQFTRDTSLTSSTQAITGVGFTPSLVVFFVGNSFNTKGSVGFDNGTTHMCLADSPASAVRTNNPSYSIYTGQADTPYYVWQAVISAFGADGFTVSWTVTGTQSGEVDITYLAIK